MNKHHEGFGLIVILILMVAVSMVGVAIFYVYSTQKDSEENYVPSTSTSIDLIQNSDIDPADFERYNKKGISFEYPKDWILSSTNTAELSQHLIAVTTNDYKYKGKPTSIRTFRVQKGYALEVSSSKSSVFSSTKEIYDYLNREGQPSAKIINTENGFEMVEMIGMDSPFPDYQSNSFTQAKFVYNGFIYSVVYYYPNSEKFISNPKYIDEYRHLLDTLKVSN